MGLQMEWQIEEKKLEKLYLETTIETEALKHKLKSLKLEKVTHKSGNLERTSDKANTKGHTLVKQTAQSTTVKQKVKAESDTQQSDSSINTSEQPQPTSPPTPSAASQGNFTLTTAEGTLKRVVVGRVVWPPVKHEDEKVGVLIGRQPG